MEVQHKAWDWSNISAEYWNEVSEEFLPVAIQWREKYHSILDIGAGKGRHSFFFAKNGFSVDAIDLSESGIAHIRKKAEEDGLPVRAVVADMTELPFEDGKFDCIICFHTIYHTSYDGVVRALQEIYRVLKEGGEAFISFNTKENPHYDPDSSLDGYTMILSEGQEKGIPHCYVDESDLFDLLQEFTIISMNKTVNYIRKGRGTHGVHYYVHIQKK